MNLISRASVCLVVFLAVNARAAVTNVAWYHLGDGDPNAVSGAAANQTKDSAGTFDLSFPNGAVYSADVAPGALHVGGGLSIQFTNGQWGSNAAVPALTNNFGLECWVKPAATNGSGQIIAYNGNTSTGGWGLIIDSSNNYGFLYGGVAARGTNAATPNVWAHLAVVCNGGFTKFYVNGVPTANGGLPTSFSGNFALGAPPQGPTNQFFSGLIDEVRIFSFAPGQFSTNDLLLNQTLNHSFAVTTLADSGGGSLRFLIDNAYDADSITFTTNGALTLTSGELQISKNITITGPGPTNLSVSANNSGRIFHILSSNLQVTINSLTIRNGNASPGGAIYNAGALILNFCSLTANGTPSGANVLNYFGGQGGSSANGGAIYSSGSLWLNNCALYANGTGNGGSSSQHNGTDGAAFGNGFAGGAAGSGGAIYTSGYAKIVQCTLVNNFTGQGGKGGDSILHLGNEAPGRGGPGGSGGAIFSIGTIDMVACTIGGNACGPGGAGGLTGDVYGNFGAPSAPSGDAGIGGGICNSGVATAVNTIIAANTGPAPSADVAGVMVSLGHNLVGQNTTNGFTNGINGDLAGSISQPLNPGLAPLADNGAKTSNDLLTAALEPASPALDAGDDAILSPPYSLAADQRGMPRKFGPHVDIGAFESQVAPLVPTANTLPISIVTLQATVNPAGYPTMVYFQYGLTSAYGQTAAAGTLPAFNTSNNLVLATITNLLSSQTYHYRVVASNSTGVFFGGDQFISTANVQTVPGDINGDGVVDPSEFAVVESNYFRASPYLLMTNAAGLGQSNVTFAVTNFDFGAVTVEYSDDLSTWQALGPATPRYLFTDTNAPLASKRYYRLRWP